MRAFPLLLGIPIKSRSGVFIGENAHRGCGPGRHRQGECSTRLLRAAVCIGLIAVGCGRAARAIEVKISEQALERTLQTQLFTGAGGRYYIRGSTTSACFVYAEAPHVSFKDDRVFVHVHARAKLGAVVHGSCIGVSLATDADVSFVPDAEGESVGFRDARVERLSESKELNFLLVPFLSGKLPSQMKVNAADLMRKLLSQSVASTGYTLTLDTLKLHSMVVDRDALVVDVDAAMRID